MQKGSRYRLVWTFIATLVSVAMVWNFFPNGSTSAAKAKTQNERPIFENFDIRYDKSQERETALSRLRGESGADRTASLREKRLATMEESQAKLARSIPNLRVKANEQLGSPEIVDVDGGQTFLRASARAARGREAAVRSFIGANGSLYGLSEGDLAQYELRADASNPDGNLSFVYLERKINKLPVFRSELMAAFDKNGELFRTVGEITPGLNSAELDKTPAISARDAIRVAASRIGLDVDLSQHEELESNGNNFLFSRGSFTYDIPVELNYFPVEPGVAALAWKVMLVEDVPGYLLLIDAIDGTLYFRKNLTNDQTQAATYVVYDSDSPAPFSPTTSLPNAMTQGGIVPRTSFTLISEGAAFNNLGWLTDGVTTTTGNNVDSGIDAVAPDGIEFRPTSATRVFDFAYNPAPGSPAPGEDPTGVNYRSGESVNMFFWTNRYHDRMYEVGFTEAFRNFQQSNFGRNPGGATANAQNGNDRVSAQGQDASGTDNANFFTPADGTAGRMQMYRFIGPAVDRSSGLDQEIIIHELTHGLSNRLHNNAAGLSADMSRGMGEGWSDFYARVLLSTPDEDVAGLYSTGGYSTLDITAPTAFNANYYYGIRRFPYALRATVGANGRPHNPLTFADIDASKINLTDGAFPRGPVGSATAHAVHNVGEVWSNALLEVRARMIARTGYAVGNQRILQLVTDGMKLDPVNPTLLDGRNSILLASAASGGDVAEQDDIWRGFATRGMGFGATVTPAATIPITVTESFDLPNLTVGAVTIDDENCPEENDAADPGETVQLSIPLNNPLLIANATNVTAEVVGGGSASYGTIAANSSGTQTISYTVPADADCGDVLTLTVNINSSLGPISRTFQLPIGTPTGLGASSNFSTGNIAVPLPDVATTEIPIEVAGDGRVGDVNVKVRLNHTFDADLQMRIVAPDGSSVPLALNRGGSGVNFGTGANDCSGNSTTFDDSAATAISAGTAPFNGTFRPETPLSGLRGKQIAGTWKLRITDTGALDVGTAGCVQLQITEQFYYCCGVDGDPSMIAAPPATLVAESAVPANNAPDPDELVTMQFPLENVGSGKTTNLVATLLSGGGVTPQSGPQSYGEMSPIGGPVSRSFTFVPRGNCGENVTATFALSDGGVDLGTVSFTIRLGAIEVGGGSFANSAAVTIPGTGTGAVVGSPANPYPSTINVAGVTGAVTKVTATINDFSHTFPADVDILLVGPTGRTTVLLSDAGGSVDAVNVDLTFDDSAVGAVPGTLVSGTFRPTNITLGDVYPAPAPAGPHGVTLGGFNGQNPNGAWSLFIMDDATGDIGALNTGWSLSITTETPVCNVSACALTVANISVPNDPGQPGAIVNFPTVVNGSVSIGVTGTCGIVTSNPTSGSFFTVGTTPVNVTATRADASTTTASFNVTVVDVEPPVISGESVSPDVLWPPNHRLVRTQVDYTVNDNFTPPASIVRALSVTSNEPINGTGDGDTAPDWIVSTPNALRVRAERAGKGNGRIYTITITATDEAGNKSSKQVFVRVPKSQRFGDEPLKGVVEPSAPLIDSRAAPVNRVVALPSRRKTEVID